MPVVAAPECWVVRCTGCGCVITAFATDPQAEHLSTQEASSPPYKGAVHVTCSCCSHVYRYLEDAIFRGRPQQSEQCRRNGSPKSDGALLVTAGTIAAIRLKGEPVQPSPKLKSVIHDSVSLARLVLAEISEVTLSVRRLSA